MYYWAKKGKERLTVVKTNKQDILEEQEYLTLLKDRVQNLAEESENVWENFQNILPNSELALLIDWQESRSLGNLGEDLIMHSLNSWTTLPLELNEVKFPVQMKQDSRLEDIYNDTNLFEWISESYPH